MSPPRARSPRRRAEPEPFPPSSLAELGITAGDRVRFRRRESERWKDGVVTGRERDGSVALTDAKGASRAIDVACIEVRGTGPRGGVVWEPLTERAARTEQMRLL